MENQQPPEDERTFCGQVMWVARQMGIPMRYAGNDHDGHTYAFFDMMTGAEIVGEAKQTKKEALVAACKAFQEYLIIKK